ncbi:streptomycin 6-kinase [Mycolicibacterium chubuense NBB4]|uniref:Streptomycin 6-kinase n=1 Tax=Mycolicibacterium chubuense (strain NBB4) TaxID=710421 RepID=I4BGL5_MYCCN|nr:aminoglycoside phosphotransferase family protein [Mycolicibacterium chubuense]AFM16422.1 streptomycin 6-kinase [Mycolicibacterium chubuense NBB4]
MPEDFSATERAEHLNAAARDHLERWRLAPDGPVRRGPHALVVPVRTADEIPAVLKVSLPEADSEYEHLALRRWGGDGAVRLLSADPPRRALLLERLHLRDLSTLPDTEACEVVAGLFAHLHAPALPRLRSLTAQVDRWQLDLQELPRSAPIPRRLVEQAVASGRELAGASSAPEVLLHGDLHYANVLAADRASWLAISPDPVNGDPHYELAPMLWHRWDELTGNIRDGVRHRFYTLVDAAALDEDRARAWTVVRVVLAAVRALERADDADRNALTRYVTIAKAVQD